MGPLVPADGVGAPPELAGLLAIVDPDALDDTQTIDFLKAAARVEAWVQSCQVKALHRFALLRPGTGADRDPEGFSRYAPQEISAHLSTGEAAARALLADAKQIGAHLPGTLQAMSSGELDLPRAKALARGSADLPADCLRTSKTRSCPAPGTSPWTRCAPGPAAPATACTPSPWRNGTGRPTNPATCKSPSRTTGWPNCGSVSAQTRPTGFRPDPVRCPLPPGPGRVPDPAATCAPTFLRPPAVRRASPGCHNRYTGGAGRVT